MAKRSERLAEQITAEVADIVRQLKDPRLSAMVSVVRTELNRDLTLAKVHFSLYGSPAAVAETFQVLQHARGHVRSELAKRLSVRHTPELVFLADDSIAFADSMDRLLRGRGEDT